MSEAKHTPGPWALCMGGMDGSCAVSRFVGERLEFLGHDGKVRPEAKRNQHFIRHRSVDAARAAIAKATGEQA